MNNFKCFKCNKTAVWYYMPDSKNKDNSYYCDECVPRGCSCNIINSEEKSDFYEYYKDDLGRDIPCVEYEYYKTGYVETI